MPDTKRKPVVRIRAPRRGEPITAAFLGELSVGVQDALAGLDGPKSLKTRSTDNQINEINQGAESGRERILTATDWETSVVRVFQDNDPNAANFVDVQVFTRISFQGSDEVLTLIMPPSPNE